MSEHNGEGVIIKIGGPVLDVEFEGEAPRVRDLLISADGKHMEVAANASPGVVRCIALEATDGMRCGTQRIMGNSIRTPASSPSFRAFSRRITSASSASLSRRPAAPFVPFCSCCTSSADRRIYAGKAQRFPKLT